MKLLSRREWIGRVLIPVGVGGLIRSGHAAETTAKVSKAVAKYQDYPNNGQTCRTCKLFIPAGGRSGSGMRGGQMGPGMMGGHMGGMSGQMGPGMMTAGTCEVVEGSISPMGWCVLYQPLSVR
jgi:hypothetical protein